jgi:L-ascorbate metabolism protein UlaG (beta-lactamase superfamily)
MSVAHALGRELLADVRAADPSPRLLHVWWLGQSGFLLAHDGRHLLLDPYLSDSLTRKYAGSDTPHERLAPIVVEPGALDFVAAVTASHHHTDHLDPGTLAPLLAAAPQARLVAPAAHRELALARAEIDGERLVTLDDGEAVVVEGFEIAAVPAAHETLARDEAGRLLHLGYVVRAGALRIYHAGDTVPYDGMAQRIGAVDLALLPINGRDPARGVAGNLDGEEAAQLAAALPARTAVPCHYGTFAFNSASPDTFVRACERLGVRHAVLDPGRRLTLSADSADPSPPTEESR